MTASGTGVRRSAKHRLVLEMKVPHGADLPALTPVLPIFLSYLLSFVYAGIYWNNHLHMFQVVALVNAAMSRANLLYLQELTSPMGSSVPSRSCPLRIPRGA